MPTPPLQVAAANAYAMEASTWAALQGHLPGHPYHDPVAWAAWLIALRFATRHSEAAAVAAHARQHASPIRVRA